MTDAATNTPESTSPKSGSIDDITASILVPAPVDDPPRKRKKTKPAAREAIEDVSASTPASEKVEDAAGGPPVPSVASSDALESAIEETPSEAGEDADASDLQAEGEGKGETLFDEWADYDDTSKSADDGPGAEGDDDAAVKPLAITDDMTLSVKVDGETQEVTIADLKQRYAGEGAIEKRLQEATEAKKTVHQQIEHNRAQFAQVLNAVGGMLFTPQTQAPDQALAKSDPARFLEMQQAHHHEVAELTVRKQQLSKIMSDADATIQASTKAMRADEAAKLRKALPVLNDPVRGPKVQQAILTAAKELYGFSDVDIAAAADHRIFVMAADAMRYRKLMAKTKAVPTIGKARTIKPRGGANKPRTPSAVKKEQRRMDKARKTGHVDDIAASMIVAKPSTGRRGGVR